MSKTSERLYQLLPSFYRLRDAEQGEPLRALLGILEEERRGVEADIVGLYDNWFVETCDEWVLSYIGELIGVQPLRSISSRAFTANSLAHRRRKGTLRTLESVARDVSGWPARAVEFIKLVAANQNINSERPSAVVIPDLRQAHTVQLIGGPFEQVARSVDVRRSGKYEVSQIGLYLWRLEAYPIEGAQAAPHDVTKGHYWFNPIGRDQALWSPRDTGVGAAASTDENSVPQPLRRRALYDALEAHRQAFAEGRTPHNPYFNRQPVLRVSVAGPEAKQAISEMKILIADLSEWWTLPEQEEGDMAIAVAVDPVLGRLAFAKGKIPAAGKVWVSYYYGFASELGGGGYDRQSTLIDLDGDSATKYLRLEPGDPEKKPAAKGILWQPLEFPSDGRRRLVVELPDSQNYRIVAQSVEPGMQLEIRARNGHRPQLIVVNAQGASVPGCPVSITLPEGSSLTLNGLLLPEGLSIAPPMNEPPTTAALTLVHCTLLPGKALSVAGGFSTLAVDIRRSIIGSIGPSGSVEPEASGIDLTVSDSILDGEVKAWRARMQCVTALAAVSVDVIAETADCIFFRSLVAQKGKAGGVSYCYYPVEGSSLPAGAPENCKTSPRPWFTSTEYGAPGYGQLDARCPQEIRRGASDEGELGALHHRYDGQREDNLRSCCDDYVRFGMTLNLFYAT